MPAGYDAWNRALAQRYFTNEMSGRPVYLDTDDDLLSDVGAAVGAGDWWQDFSDSVKATFVFGGHGALRKHTAGVDRWRGKAREASAARKRVPAPPVIALLTLLSRIAGEMGEDEHLAKNAYYPLVSKKLDLSSSQQHEFTAAYQKHAESLWRTLNDFLSLNDGLVGTPTAYSLGHRYVGLPQSQALVRAIDRERLPRLFLRFGLAPGSDMVPADMARLLDLWISQNPPPVSANLGRLWGKGSARERIASIVATELASWDGTVPAGKDDGSVASGSLHVSAMLQKGLGGRRLEVSFLITMPGGASERVVVVSSPGEPTLDVQQVDGARSRPRFGTSFDLGTLMEGVVTIVDSTSRRSVSRTPRRVVPLRKDELLGYFVEVERVSLAEDHLLLVKDEAKVVTAVDTLLAGVTGRHGIVYSSAEREGSETLRGVPAGWLLYDSVQVYAAPEHEPALADLTALVPLSTAQVTFNGGLKLPGRVRKWSSLMPPEVRAVVADAKPVKLHLLDEEGEVVHRWESDQPIVVAPLDDVGLPDGDYVLRLSAGAREVAEHTIRLRSSDSPDLISWETASRLLYDLESPWGALSAENAHVETSGPVIDGPWAPASDFDPGELSGAPSHPLWDKALRPAAAPSIAKAVPLGEVDPDSCVVTGAHLLRLPTFYGKAKGSIIEGTCERCGIVKRFPSHPKKRVTRNKGAAPQAHDIVLSELPPIEERPVEWDDALDALVHVGGGSIAALERIANQIEASSLFVDDFLRTLETLGQIDVRRGSHLEPVEWEVPPTYIAGTADQRWTLCGVWSRTARRSLGSAVQAAGGSLEALRLQDQPTVWQVTGLDEETLSDICTQDSGWTLAPDAAERIARALPPLSRLREQLPLINVPAHSTTVWFDVASASWVPVVGVVRPGAYRLTQSFRTVDVHINDEELKDRQCRVGTVQLVKHLAAQQRGSLLAYRHGGSGHLVVPLGTDLPGLYGRAAVLCSMERPRRSTKLGVLAYPKVSPLVADLICDRLSS